MSLVRVGKLTNSNRNTRSIDAVYETKLRGTVVRFGKGMRWGVIVHILHSGCTLGMKFRGGNWGGEGGGAGRLHGLRVDEQHSSTTEYTEIRTDIVITPTM